MKKNTRSKVKSLHTLKSLSSEENAHSPTHLNVLNNSLIPESLNSSLSSSKKIQKTKLKLVVPEVPHHSKEHPAMTKDDSKKISLTPPNTLFENTPFSSLNSDLKFPDIMDFYKGWMSFYGNQWQLFFNAWSQFLGKSSSSSTVLEEQTKEFHHYYTSLAQQFQECASIAHRATQETIKIMQESSPSESTDSKNGIKDNTKKSS